ncbi:MAG: tRNA lysidine(34) synthetase TilS [Thermomicrobiales bacterium]
MSHSEYPVNRRAFARIRRTAVYHAVCRSWDERTIAACSGGTDSTALVAVAAIALDAGRIPGFIVTHVDHRTRPGTDAEGQFVAALARSFGLPFVQLSIADKPDEKRGGAEAVLRSGRYSALAELSGRLGMSGVATAHTRDDQIESILLRLLSGSSSVALAGMRDRQILATRSGPIAVRRPLLEITRPELTEVLDLLGLPHIDDPSNEDVRYRRNRLRHRVIRELEALDPGFGAGLIRATSLARADGLVVDRIASQMRDDHVVERRHTRIVPLDVLRSTDAAISSRIVQHMILELIEGDARELTHERIMAVVGAAGGRQGSVIELPYEITARVGKRELTIVRQCGTEGGETDD